MPEADPSFRLVGRDDEMSTLRAALDDAVRGRGGAVFISGESGMGKTRLLSELALAARDRGVDVLAGSAIDVGDNLPFWPLKDALRRFLRDVSNDWASVVLRPWQNYIDTLLSGARTDSSVGTSERVPEQLSLDILLQVINALAGHGPLLVTLDDMQWADQSTRRLLTYCLATLIDEPVLFAVAYRDEGDSVQEGPSVHDLAVDLARRARATRLRLAPLRREAIAELLPGDDPRLVDEVLRRSGGNALFAEQIVRCFRDRTSSAVPDSVRDLVRARVRRVSSGGRRVLNALAIGDEPVPHSLLEAVLDTGSELLEAIRLVVGSGLVQVDEDGEGYRLCHGIVREVLVSDLLPGERLALHRQYAEVIEREPRRDFRTAERLALHWRGAGVWARALPATLVAAENAESAFGYAEAVVQWTAAADLSAQLAEPSVAQADLRRRAARAAYLAGDYDRALSLVDESLGDTSSQDLALIHDERGQYLAGAGRIKEAVAEHAHAVALLPADASPEVQASVLLGHADALERIGQYAQSRDEARAALGVAEAAGLDSLRARVLPTLGFSLAYCGQPDEGLAAMAEGLQVARALGSPYEIGKAYLSMCNLLCGPLNRLSEGIDFGRRATAAVTGLGLGRTTGVMLQALVANALFRIGEWDAAGEVVEAALSVRPTGSAAMELRLARSRLLVNSGAFDAAQRELDTLETLCAEAVGPRFRIPVLTLRAGLAMWRQNPGLARRYVAQALAETPSDSKDLWVIAPLVWHGFRAEADAAEQAGLAVTGPQEEEIANLDAWMARLARQAPTAALPIQDIVRGYLRLSEAEQSRMRGASDPALWELAATIWEENLHPYPAAYARFRQAEALFARRARAAGAARHLTWAHRVASALPARSLIAEIEALARRAGLTLSLPERRQDSLSVERVVDLSIAGEDAVRRPVPDPLAELTERERLVLSGLAEGRSNRQIARMLFISEKTVSVHVSRILSKLGVHSRVQAAMLAHRLVEAEVAHAEGNP